MHRPPFDGHFVASNARVWVPTPLVFMSGFDRPLPMPMARYSRRSSQLIVARGGLPDRHRRAVDRAVVRCRTARPRASRCRSDRPTAGGYASRVEDDAWVELDWETGKVLWAELADRFQLCPNHGSMRWWIM